MRKVVNTYVQVFFIASLLFKINEREIPGSLFITAFLGSLVVVGFDAANKYLDKRMKNRNQNNHERRI